MPPAPDAEMERAAFAAWHHRSSEVAWEEQEANEEVCNGRKGRADQRLIDLSPAL